MLRQRLLDALDSPMPLLFVEAIKGAGKQTLLSQWVRAAGRGGRSELRFLFDAEQVPVEIATLIRQFWTVLRRQPDLHLPELPSDDEQLMEFAGVHLHALRRPIGVAVIGAENLSSASFSHILSLLDVGMRLIISGVDVSHLAGAQARGIYYSTLSDQDLAFTLEETRQFMAQKGAGATGAAAASMYRATLGHPAMISACLATMPVESAHGLLTRDRAIGAFLAEVPLKAWPSAFAKFLAETVHLPRFTAREAALIAGTDDAAHAMERLRSLAVGRVLWHPALRERVFSWDEPSRRVVAQFLARGEAAAGDRLGRVLEAARECEDDELLISTLIEAGDLDQAEALLREAIWDVLPNAMAPLWAPLAMISPLHLTERPALLAARLRLSFPRSQSPVSVRAAQAAGRAMDVTPEPGSPWGRVGALAFAIEFALYAGERERLIDLFARARALIADLVASDAAAAAGGREVSDLLLIAEAAFRSGNTIPAAEIARLALHLVEHHPERLDPCGERRAFACRLVLHDHRARGLEDPFAPEPLLAGAQFLWREGEVVVAAMALMWGDLDDGEFALADAHLRAAADRLADPERWPILMLMRAHLAVLRQSPGELETYISAYERGTLSVPGSFAQQSLSQMVRITDYLGKKVGRALPSPGFLPASPEPDRLFYPRVDFTVRLMEALYAVRTDRPSAARAALALAVALSPRRALGVYTLSNATKAEIAALREIAEDIPGGSRLRLGTALRFPGALEGPTVELSDREREVLAYLREGATNPEMAQAMFVSVNTVKFHRANLMRKLEATSRADVLETAGKLGL